MNIHLLLLLNEIQMRNTFLPHFCYSGHSGVNTRGLTDLAYQMIVLETTVLFQIN